jgi:hypothetical protein
VQRRPDAKMQESVSHELKVSARLHRSEHMDTRRNPACGEAGQLIIFSPEKFAEVWFRLCVET